MIRVRKIENRAGKILKRVVFYMGREIYRRDGFERERERDLRGRVRRERRSEVVRRERSGERMKEVRWCRGSYQLDFT